MVTINESDIGTLHRVLGMDSLLNAFLTMRKPMLSELSVGTEYARFAGRNIRTSSM